MDPDEVARLVNELKLSTDTEAEVIDVSNTISLARSGKLSNHLVAKIFSTRVVNRDALRSQLPRILQLRRDADIEIVGDNIFVIVFKSEDDKIHALQDGPWNFFDNLMVFKETSGWQNPSDIEFLDLTIWIQLHNLPIACMNPKSVAKIAEQVGKVKEIDTGEGGNCIGQFARARVTRPIAKPLQRCVRISQGSSDEKWIVLIAYERLPDFCFHCGRVGHVRNHCKEEINENNLHNFGPWLRARRVLETRRKKGLQQSGSTKQDEPLNNLVVTIPSHSKIDNSPSIKHSLPITHREGEEESHFMEVVAESHPQISISHFLRNRYLKGSDIMDYKLKGNVSYIWGSVCWSRDLIAKGIRWKLGNGHNIRICQDAWILGLWGGRCTPRQDLAPIWHSKVVNFVGVDGSWNSDLLNFHFLPFEVKAILDQTPPIPAREDMRFWIFDNKGTYNVKSGYLLETGSFLKPDNRSSEGEDIWAKLSWKLTVPPKVKIFLWKMFHNFLPVGSNLLSHHVPVVGACTQCKLGWESTTHALIFCPKVKPFWYNSKFWTLLAKYKHATMMEIGCFLRSVLTKEDFEAWAMMIWDLWNFLCHIKHENDSSPLSFDADRSLALLLAFKDASKHFEGMSFLKSLAGERRWKPVKDHCFRMDVDAAYDPINGRYGVGVIIRDRMGSIVVAWAKKIPPTLSAYFTEITAIHHGVLLSLEEKVKPIHLFTDSLLVTYLLNDSSQLGENLPEELKETYLLIQEGVVNVYHMYRSANAAAHALAQHAANSPCSSKWSSNFPPWLLNIVSSDLE
ncbi:hypothetical protein OROMI_003995 [Orobanche minor]